MLHEHHRRHSDDQAVSQKHLQKTGHVIKKTLREKEIATEVAEISMVPQNTIPINDAQTAKKIISLMETFEDHEDVQNAYANFDIPEEIIARIS